MDILYLCILLFEFQIFLKRKRIDTEGNISSGQVSRYFRRHHSGIGACHIKVNIIIRCQGVYYFLPSFNFLNLIQKEIRSPSWIELFFDSLEHILRCHILIIHGIEAHTDNPLKRNVMLLLQLLHDHFKNCRFSAAANTRQHFYKRCVGVCHNLINVERSVYHRNHLHDSIILQAHKKINRFCDYKPQLLLVFIDFFGLCRILFPCSSRIL